MRTIIEINNLYDENVIRLEDECNLKFTMHDKYRKIINYKRCPKTLRYNVSIM